jgi:hypothetical protein
VFQVADPVDVYADQFQLLLGPYGCSLTFSLTDPVPAAPGTQQHAERQATIRMSLEHAKIMVLLLRRQILAYEREAAVNITVPRVVLNQLQVGPEDWDALWPEGGV